MLSTGVQFTRCSTPVREGNRGQMRVVVCGILQRQVVRLRSLRSRCDAASGMRRHDACLVLLSTLFSMLQMFTRLPHEQQNVSHISINRYVWLRPITIYIDRTIVERNSGVCTCDHGVSFAT